MERKRNPGELAASHELSRIALRSIQATGEPLWFGDTPKTKTPASLPGFRNSYRA
ncbi:hypothetical protein I6F09_06300 [Bradyrhizobium sp. IC3195]|uniref:hypothetical protein n=1 Tax=Bradyrhizobium sp. IC3195 TaxID=2793804 RepID=UPI001CD1E3DA|nr:hypothetical protein [Bradyrhizobium sp. IC3195]MCA1467494.1 hypothetical protein [Bradyrhizobium sp. IC3195]